MEKFIETIIIKPGLARLIIRSVPDEPGIAARVFKQLGEQGFNIENISASTSVRPQTDITFTVNAKHLEPVLKTLKSILPELGGQDVIFSRSMAIVSLCGEKIAHTPGAAGQVFSALADKGINLEVICGSIDTINILLDERLVKESVALIKERFGLPGI